MKTTKPHYTHTLDIWSILVAEVIKMGLRRKELATVKKTRHVNQMDEE